MSKNPTHSADEVAPEVFTALASAVYPSDVGEVRLAELSPQGAVYMLSYGIKKVISDASANIKSETQNLALKSVLSADQLSAEEREELKTLEENFDDSVEGEADEALLKNVARGYIQAVARQRGVQLTPDAVKEGIEAYLGPFGPKAPSYPALMRVYGLVKSVVIEAKRARLQACRDGTIGQAKSRPGKAKKTDGALAALGLFN